MTLFLPFCESNVLKMTFLRPTTLLYSKIMTLIMHICDIYSFSFTEECIRCTCTVYLKNNYKTNTQFQKQNIVSPSEALPGHIPFLFS